MGTVQIQLTYRIERGLRYEVRLTVPVALCGMEGAAAGRSPRRETVRRRMRTGLVHRRV
ncbi:MAG: hypothetical protein M3228_13730 [Actinomycetota bacterium]|nr:hypothetical protein [Actinomycetota bacterium]